MVLTRNVKLARISVHGVVQGVGFRPFVFRLAHEHGLTGWVRNRFGFNPLLIASFWAVLELGLIRINIIEGFFGGVYLSIPIFGAVSALFGFVLVSFIIVLVNSLLLAAIDKIAKYIKAADNKYPEGVYARWIFTYRSGYSKVLEFVPESRGPPLIGFSEAF